MRCLGILSVRENTDEKNTRRTNIVQKDQFAGTVLVVVAEITASVSEIQTMCSVKKRWLRRRGEKFLYRLGCDAVVLTDACRDAFGVSGQKGMMVETDIPPEEMGAAVDYALGQYGEFPLGKTGWVLDRECRRVNLSILGAMSRKVQFLGVATEEPSRADMLEELLCEEYGVNLEVIKPEALWKQNPDILVDMDGGRVCFGRKTVLKGRKLILDLRGYEVDLKHLLERYPEFWGALSFLEWS